MSVIGNAHNFWLATEEYIDLTRPCLSSHPNTSDNNNINHDNNDYNASTNNVRNNASVHLNSDGNHENRTPITIKTTTDTIRIDPCKTALAIIDMQNFFLSPALGRPRTSPAQQAVTNLVSILPAVRTVGIQVCYINWGLTSSDLETMPPAARRAFGERLVPGSGKDPKLYAGLGKELGAVKVNGEQVDAGRMLVAGSWNTLLYGDLELSRLSSLESASSTRSKDSSNLKTEGSKSQDGNKSQRFDTIKTKEDIILTKNRMSALTSDSNALKFFEKQGITTIIFAGVNTDQCVLGSLLDGFNQGYDCILLRDGCATTSPSFATECVEFNVGRTMGFVTDCLELKAGIERMEGMGS